MAFESKQWLTGETITQAELNRIETGIEAAHGPVDASRLPVADETTPGLVSLGGVSSRAEAVTQAALADVVHSDELFTSVILTSEMATTVTTLFVAPFPLRITTARMVFDVLTLPASETKYLEVTLRKYTTGGQEIVSRSSADGEIVPRVPWLFDSATWDQGAAVLAAGDMVNLGFTSVGGTGTLAEFPAVITMGYEPV